MCGLMDEDLEDFEVKELFYTQTMLLQIIFTLHSASAEEEKPWFWL